MSDKDNHQYTLDELEQMEQLHELEQRENELKAHKMWKALCLRMNRATDEQRDLGHALFLDIALQMDIEVHEQKKGETRSKVIHAALCRLPLDTIINFLHKCHLALNKEGISLRDRPMTRDRARSALCARSARDEPHDGQSSPRGGEPRSDSESSNGHAHHNQPRRDDSGRQQKPRYRPDEAVLEGEQPNKHSEKRAQSEDPAAGQRKKVDKPRELDEFLDPMRRPWGLTRGNDLPQ